MFTDEIGAALKAKEGALYRLADTLWNTPELGFFERETASILAEELASTGAQVTRDIALTGIKAEVGPPGAPAIVLLADMDALPTHGAPGGVMHSCGHHAQMAVLATVFRTLVEADIPRREGVRLIFVGSPAEEYVDLERRYLLRQKGLIRYLSGKQEQIRLGVFDDAAVVIKYHAMADSPNREITVNGTLNGFIATRAEFTGRTAHAGAHPHEGINALGAATLALNAIHYQRETFRDDDHIRVHPILSEGGTVINSVPARAILETYVRGASHAAISDASAKVDRALCAGALAMGASVLIRHTPGYQAFRPSPSLGKVLGAAAREVAPADKIDFDNHGYASDDIGDVACLWPTCQLGCSGFRGTIHSSDFALADYTRAYMRPAEIVLRTVLDLSGEGGRKARTIKEEFVPEFTRAVYEASLDSAFSERSFSGGSIGFSGL